MNGPNIIDRKTVFGRVGRKDPILNTVESSQSANPDRTFPVFVESIDLVICQPVRVGIGSRLPVSETPQPGVGRADPEIACSVFKDGFYLRIAQLLFQRVVNNLAVPEQTETAGRADP